MQETPNALHELARRALAVLNANGVAVADGAITTTLAVGESPLLDISYRGPDLPESVPEAVADYRTVAAQPPGWVGTHRLMVRAPLVVFDLCWNDNEPLRIMGFSRGEWEDSLMKARL